MDYILDTHVAMWAIEGSEKLSDDAKELISDENNNIYFSALSVMEIAIKHQKNPSLMKRSGKEFYEICLEAGYLSLPFKPKHAAFLDQLKRKEGFNTNGDPFDRGLIAQAKQENMYLLTHDKIMDYYDETCIRMI